MRYHVPHLVIQSWGDTLQTWGEAFSESPPQHACTDCAVYASVGRTSAACYKLPNNGAPNTLNLQR